MAKMEKNRITELQRSKAEAQIREKQDEVKYDLRDFTVDYLVKEFQEDRFYIPPYQRKFIWPERHKCRFVESVLLGLPIPMMFVADMEDGRLEIVDGAQRIQTLECFKNGDLKLSKLERLPALDGFRFNDLGIPRQRKFDSRALRLVVLEDSTSPETRQEIFDRVNTSGVRAKPSEIRRGAHQGAFMTFVTNCAKDKLFQQLCPMSKVAEARYESEELVLRFFAYSESYKSFKHDVDNFLTNYLKKRAKSFNQDKLHLEFKRMLDFVNKHFPYGFRKNSNSKSTQRVRFEAISVGVNLALREKPELIPYNPSSWLESDEFKNQTTTHASNSQVRLSGRIEFVRENLLRGKK